MFNLFGIKVRECEFWGKNVNFNLLPNQWRFGANLLLCLLFFGLLKGTVLLACEFGCFHFATA